jgi:hypothetical protein
MMAMAAIGPTPDPPMRKFLNALRMVETGGEKRPEQAVGDGGRSLGPYQISRKYLIDSGVKGTWEQCRDARFSEKVMQAYWRRYCPEALRKLDFETLARVHNGGPTGHKKAATAGYWKLVQRQMKTASPPRPSGSRKRARVVG